MYRRLLTWVRPHWRVFALGVLGMVMTAATEPLFPALMKHLLDSGFVAKDETDIILIPAAMIGIFIIRGVSTYASGYSMAWVAAKVVLDLRQAMFRRLLTLPTKFYDDQSTGALISKVAYDVTNVTQAATGVLTTVIRDSLTILGLLGFLLYLDWKLTMIALTVGPVILGVIKIFSKRLRAASRSGYSAMGLITHILEEAVGAHKVVKIFGGQKYEAARFDGATNVYRRATMREAAAAAATVPLTQVAAATSVAIITYIALRQSAGPNGTTVGEFLSFVTALLMLLAPVKRLTDVSNPLQRGLAAAESVFQVLDETPEDDTGKVELQRASGHLKFDQVNFSYPGTSRPALEDIDLEIMPGQTVALVGASGSGKTTMAALIPRFYHLTTGRLLLDDHHVDELKLESLRNNIALVSQDVVLFNDTVRANIAYGFAGQSTEEEIIAAAKAANAWEFIGQMDKGLDTEVGENGVKLSGGQRQRLAIARAFLKNAPILILDEATSALDTESERLIQAALDTLIVGRTTVERGRHGELLAQEGVYAKLQRLQRESLTGESLIDNAGV
ncbi:MAG: lipid A export permease/ATP-binding protein MsbA [Betaproteobacteria bacterium HGW-Betaproteobacteria-6]|nr:MAG: lipid A export permease/ATP-binding protein MsbA [Betaproteobacteria bacterium HGW-Betaproteobacteria-6]